MFSAVQLWELCYTAVRDKYTQEELRSAKRRCRERTLKSEPGEMSPLQGQEGEAREREREKEGERMHLWVAGAQKKADQTIKAQGSGLVILYTAGGCGLRDLVP